MESSESISEIMERNKVEIIKGRAFAAGSTFTTLWVFILFMFAYHVQIFIQEICKDKYLYIKYIKYILIYINILNIH
jgi:hypothetical protein